MISELHEIGGDNADAAFATFSRAMREDPRNEIDARPARSPGPWPRQVARGRRALRSGRDRGAGGRSQGRAPVPPRPDPGARARATTKGAVATYERVLKVVAVDRRGGHRDPDDPRAHRRLARSSSTSMKRKSEILPNVDERKQLLYRAAQIEEEVLGERGRRDRDVPPGAVDRRRRHDRDGRPRAPLRPPRAVGAAQGRLRQEGRPRRGSGRQEGDALRARAGLRPRARRRRARRSRPTRASSISTPTSCRRSSPSTGSTVQAERWYDLLANLERQVELAETTGETVALKYRIGHLWQIRLGDVARAIESYREALEMDPSHAETLHALDGLVHGKVEPVMAARVLEPIYETAGEYAKLVDVLEVMVAHNEDPLARVELLHRIAQLHEQMIGNAHAAFDAYARALARRLAATSSRSVTSSASPRSPARGSRSRSCTQAEAEQVARRPAPGRSATRASRASTSRSSATSTKAIATLQQDPRGRVRQQARRARARSPVLGRPARGPSSPRSCAARSSSPRTTTRSPRCSSASARPSRRSSATARAPSRSIARSSTAHPTHERDARLRSRRCSTPATSRWRSARSSSRSTRRRASSASCTRIHEVQLDEAGRPGPPGDVPAPRGARRDAPLRSDQGARRGGPRRSSRIRAGSARSKRASGSPARPVRGTTWSPRTRARSSGTHGQGRAAEATLLRLARVHEFELHDAAHAVETHLAVLEIEPKDADALAALDRLYLNAGDVRRPRRDPAPPHRGGDRIPTSSSSCTSAAARSSATRSATSSRRSAATRPCSIRRAATVAPSRRSRASTSAARTGSSCSRPTRS